MRIKQGAGYLKPSTNELQYVNYFEFGLLESGTKNVRRVLRKNSIVERDTGFYERDSLSAFLAGIRGLTDSQNNAMPLKINRANCKNVRNITGY